MQSRYRAPLECLAAAKFLAVKMPIQSTGAFESIQDFDKSSPATSDQVAEALRHAALFNVGKPATARMRDLGGVTI